MPFKITPKRTLLAILALGFWLLFMIVGDGLAVLVTLIGTQVTVDLGAVGSIQPYNHALKHVKAVTLRTSAQKLMIGFDIAVTRQLPETMV